MQKEHRTTSIAMLPSLFKAFYWGLVSILIGGVQLFVTWVVTSPIDGGHFEFTEFLFDGMFLFFSIAIMCSIVYDFCLDSVSPTTPFWESWGRYVNSTLVIILIIVVGYAISLYSSIFLLHKQSHTIIPYYTLMNSEIIVCIIAIVFAVFLKWIIYYREFIKQRL